MECFSGISLVHLHSFPPYHTYNQITLPTNVVCHLHTKPTTRTADKHVSLHRAWPKQSPLDFTVTHLFLVFLRNVLDAYTCCVYSSKLYILCPHHGLLHPITLASSDYSSFCIKCDIHFRHKSIACCRYFVFVILKIVSQFCDEAILNHNTHMSISRETISIDI